MKTFKALGALLDYPSEPLLEALPDLHAVIVDESLMDEPARRGLRSLMREMAALDPIDLQERYVAVFDRSRQASLHLFEHVHGDSRDRGQALVDLLQVYERCGLRLAPGEFPDFLPAMLEFLSARPLADGREMLGECAHVLRAIGTHLRDRGSSYAAVFAALLEIAGAEGLGAPDPAATDTAEEDRSALDEAWAEQPAFGAGGGEVSCSAAAAGRGCGPLANAAVRHPGAQGAR